MFNPFELLIFLNDLKMQLPISINYSCSYTFLNLKQNFDFCHVCRKKCNDLEKLFILLSENEGRLGMIIITIKISCLYGRQYAYIFIYIYKIKNKYTHINLNNIIMIRFPNFHSTVLRVSRDPYY